ncbi:type II secretion system minor pseudopilin GspI [Extensimonas vulgaris]|uniref:Type II secretion system protein I n=1 Tax=Extensimonas vulgaris TaxID=1031594 RepID=A0A369AMJ3_9BURK|nr:type II secretion system minor pseudopilin GspI [Extensimonas vulgaris]RCX09496.1 general secretion pathway protein I [Extensimonas vulgaris]TWI38626.1 general secretion pathway protein I [Extensimonas vulgaris]TXD14524.1 type II secretion system protein GspI [Extensimonas vulgaris]
MSPQVSSSRRPRRSGNGLRHSQPSIHLSPQRSAGFTLVEVLVALAIVATALLAGVQATNALTRHAQREADVLLAQLCAENELVKVRLARQMPDVGDSTQACAQAGRELAVAVHVRPTPNPSFRRVEAQVFDEGARPILRLATIVGRY